MVGTWGSPANLTQIGIRRLEPKARPVTFDSNFQFDSQLCQDPDPGNVWKDRTTRAMLKTSTIAALEHFAAEHSF